MRWILQQLVKASGHLETSLTHSRSLLSWDKFTQHLLEVSWSSVTNSICSAVLGLLSAHHLFSQWAGCQTKGCNVIYKALYGVNI